MTNAIQGNSTPDVRSQSQLGQQAQPEARLPTAGEIIVGAARALGIQLPSSALERLLNTASPIEALMAQPSGITALRSAEPQAGAVPRAETPSTTSYTVRSGDSLSAIAARSGQSLDSLIAANPRFAANPDLIRPGDTLRINGSASGTYTVRSGDTLSAIAAKHGTDVATLARANGIANPDRISVGQELRLAGTTATTTAATRPATPTTAAPVPATPATPPPTSAAPTGAAGNGGVSAAGMDFIYNHEAVRGVSNRLHWPEGGSGVTLGPGYDMKGASRADIVRDLTAVGVDRATAERASQGAGLSGSAAREFARDNRDLINLTPTQERALLTQTVRGYADAVRAGITVPVTQNQFDAMVSFAYNVGTNGFAGSTALRRLNAGDTDGVGPAMMMWNKSGGVVNQGLINRRTDEVQLFNTPGGPAAVAPTATPRAPVAAAPVAPAETGGATQPRTPAGYAATIAASGDRQAQADLAAGRRVVVALRTDTSTTANGGRGVYDDTVAVVWRDAGGTLQAREFRGNTEPSSQYRFDGPKADRGSHTDMNRDGRADLGRLREGNYRYERQPGEFSGNTFFRATQTQAVERDTNQDGRFTAADSNRIDTSGAGRSMLIHQGGASNTWSAGCQTMAGADFNAFVRSLGGQNSFSYVLTNG